METVLQVYSIAEGLLVILVCAVIAVPMGIGVIRAIKDHRAYEARLDQGDREARRAKMEMTTVTATTATTVMTTKGAE